jgi:hypothetical protein
LLRGAGVRAAGLFSRPLRCVVLAAALAFRRTCTMRMRRCLGRWRALRWLLRRRPEARASALLASSPARCAALLAPHAQLCSLECSPERDNSSSESGASIASRHTFRALVTRTAAVVFACVHVAQRRRRRRSVQSQQRRYRRAR